MGDIDSKVISATEISNQFQKTRFWKEISVDNVVTLEGFPFKSSMISFHIWLFKKTIQAIAKQCSCSNAEFPYFVMGSHLGQWPH